MSAPETKTPPKARFALIGSPPPVEWTPPPLFEGGLPSIVSKVDSTIARAA